MSDLTKAKPQHPTGWECGGRWKGMDCEPCHFDRYGQFVSCITHSPAAYAGPFREMADENFRERVLDLLERLQAEVFFAGVLSEMKYLAEKIRDLPTGQIDDARRMAKQPKEK